MINNIIETRKREDEQYYLELEIAADEYQEIYDDYTNENAAHILELHLENRRDDGRPTDIEIQHGNSDDIVRIFAKIHYLGNDYTPGR